MAGYQVEQTTTGTETFPRHQQQPEQGTIPPIKLRRVTDNNRSVVGSSTAEQTTPEALKGESAMSAYAANRPVAVICPISRNLPTASGNSLFTGNEHLSATVQDMPEPMEGEPVTAVTNRDNLISKFSANHQSDLRTHLTDPKIQAVLDRAEVLLKTLNDRHIQLSLDRAKPLAHSIFSRLKSFNIVKELPVFSGYFTNAREFFFYVNTQQITNTSCLTSMLTSKAHIKNFAKESQENIQAVAGNPCLKQISSMCHRKGLPKEADVKALKAWDCWKVNDEFSLALLRAFSSMMSSRGLPDKAKVKALKAWDCWKVSGEFSLELLRAFSSMCHGKGLPKEADVKALKAWDYWKVNGEFSLELLRAFSSMCNGKSLPKEAAVKALKAWDCWKVNGEFSPELLRAFSSMCHGKGLPKQADVKAFVYWLPSDEKKHFLKLACRIFAGFGVPQGATLAEHSETLRQCLKEYGYSTDNGDDSSDADENCRI